MIPDGGMVIGFRSLSLGSGLGLLLTGRSQKLKIQWLLGHILLGFWGGESGELVKCMMCARDQRALGLSTMTTDVCPRTSWCVTGIHNQDLDQGGPEICLLFQNLNKVLMLPPQQNRNISMVNVLFS